MAEPAVHIDADNARQVIRLGELLGALSYALDLTEGQPPGHCVRCCWIGMNIAEDLGMGEAEKSDLYYTLLLKDIGCSSNAARICQLFATDDLSFKRGFKSVNGSLSQAMKFVMHHTGRNAQMSDKLKTLVSILKGSGCIVQEVMETRCQQGAEIARMMRFSEAVADGIHGLDEHWDGGGRPQRLAGTDIPLFSRIALLAQVVDVFHAELGPKGAMAEVRARAGKWFDPAVAAAFQSCASRPDFWQILTSDTLDDAIFALEPAQNEHCVDEQHLDEIVYAFARVIDAKSPYTHGHSERVSLYTDIVCVELGLSPEHRRMLQRAALLHDIGKLGISNTILDKPGPLTPAEMEIVKTHPALGQDILTRIAAFRPFATIAAAHHERLDGRGYPDGLTADDLTQDMRILAVADIFDALTAERPYRAAMSPERAFAIMDDLVGCAIDGDCYLALQNGLAATEHLEFPADATGVARA